MHPFPPVTGRVSRRVRPRECGGPKALAWKCVRGHCSERTQNSDRVSGLAFGRFRRGAPGRKKIYRALSPFGSWLWVTVGYCLWFVAYGNCWFVASGNCWIVAYSNCWIVASGNWWQLCQIFGMEFPVGVLNTPNFYFQVYSTLTYHPV